MVLLIVVPEHSFIGSQTRAAASLPAAGSAWPTGRDARDQEWVSSPRVVAWCGTGLLTVAAMASAVWRITVSLSTAPPGQACRARTAYCGR